ncbi:MAG: hypothetical protein FWG56_00785 [Desulfovibrionaceae bacterium]|nr:hypothetical protein [Desulfovibrionaceae bacterium]
MPKLSAPDAAPAKMHNSGRNAVQKILELLKWVLANDCARNANDCG